MQNLYHAFKPVSPTILVKQSSDSTLLAEATRDLEGVEEKGFPSLIYALRLELTDTSSLAKHKDIFVLLFEMR